MIKNIFQKTKVEGLYAHVDGQLISLEEVPDPVFNQKMMGEGIAIKPETGTIVAPADGKIIQLAETKHAFGIRTALGQEILVHIGLETVALNGEGFNVLVKVGDKVKKGQPVVEADIDFIQKNAASTVIPMVITNSSEGKYNFEFKNEAATKAGKTEVMITTLK
ncbi:PTS sugar transporter subunit IIA [Listeria ivanovii]|uniref:Putative phosphotransferase system glucose-specific enzyme IIA n=1 Tax=Listeria ivanovii (strain ATCC BAA-678 / PAM 55) TaxID=881621 RepID=G2ZE78_LISIP|nr:PTS glucose transporter subunit IIA [Listeria ivanovii]AHI55517.1 PTS glucose transporter subunit IIA [Listeria ivanovii WSLC3009]AIS64972.1 PTS glucose transporter subunit IIA [Listeria ivanovii subsp. ivanovii]MBC1758311.1 PTS glucose transporter subunit IIA [Listeria ivanovii]MBK3913188.1 PTS glucose transporter subunit IIA [Listeria ivanovii subsp. ivanovii]MBK3920695.1 PTS glucose transporter subunit IIA [Listeria ivanovii subsp. ivanovii]